MATQSRRSFLRGAGALATAAALPAAAQTPIPIRVANPAADDDPIGVAAAYFSKRVKELAGNAVALRRPTPAFCGRSPPVIRKPRRKPRSE